LETLGEASGEADYGEHQKRSLSTAENKAVSNEVAEAISTGDLDALDELMAPDIAREFKEGVAEVRRAFPDYHGTNEIQIAEGDMVANRFVFYGTHQDEFMGIAPTGREVRFTGLLIDRVVDGKIVENWIEGTWRTYCSRLGLLCGPNRRMKLAPPKKLRSRGPPRRPPRALGGLAYSPECVEGVFSEVLRSWRGAPKRRIISLVGQTL